MGDLLELRHCRLTYPSGDRRGAERLALAIDQLSIRTGDRIALLGRSGAGKSTLLHHLRRQLAHTSSWCPQQASLVPQLKAFHNIYAGALQRHSALTNLKNLLLPSPRFRAEIAALAEPLGIAELLWNKADALSGGQQQRVAVARALYQRKPVLLADEPVAALDPQQGEQVLALLLERHDTAVVALHDAGLAQRLCNRIIGLRDGALLFDCAAEKVDDAALAQLYR
ncbi:ATP-binding cassette domain-containing protein [Microbulbifer sp. SAOS-129_SWC]|uniref:ATP-binding cassette domain-containing protein n=1 Tax=Microbulbifer sp. SAOS-129_SWC TaxID=3145235 RepID=UPI003217AA4E